HASNSMLALLILAPLRALCSNALAPRTKLLREQQLTSAPWCKTVTTTGKPFLHRRPRNSLHSYRQSSSAGLSSPVDTRSLTRLKNEESLCLVLFVRESAVSYLRMLITFTSRTSLQFPLRS